MKSLTEVYNSLEALHRDDPVDDARDLSKVEYLHSLFDLDDKIVADMAVNNATKVFAVGASRDESFQRILAVAFLSGLQTGLLYGCQFDNKNHEFFDEHYV